LSVGTIEFFNIGILVITMLIGPLLIIEISSAHQNYFSLRIAFSITESNNSPYRIDAGKDNYTVGGYLPEEKVK